MIPFKSKEELLANCRKLDMDNYNNRFANAVFAQLNFAPPLGSPVVKNLVGRLYFIKDTVDENIFFVRLIKFERLQFGLIDDFTTMLISGCSAEAWKREWLAKNPNTTHKTEMCVYFYMKIPDEVLIEV